MKRLLLLVLLLLPTAIHAQVSVSPDNLTAYSQGATSAYLTFSGVVNLRPAEATWCGALISASPDAGQKCDPATIFGVLPARYDQSKLVGTRYTDIMSITPVVARRAYSDAVAGNDSRFYYVRRFLSTIGGADEYVPVTIRLSGNGAGVPFSLTTVKLTWQSGEKVVPFIRPNEKLPPIAAEIRYTGTGRLKGRWELVRPGDTLPDRKDLLSEAALPPEERGTQRRYTLLARFNVNLPPGGKHVVPGPENWRIDKTVEGMYLLLFRVEASDAPNSSSDTGAGVIPTGAVAGFAMPVLRYYVGNSSNAKLEPITSVAEIEPSAPLPITLRWKPTDDAKFYRVEIADDAKTIFTAAVLPTRPEYRLPPFIRQLALAKTLRWRVVAVGEGGRTLSESPFANVE